MFLQKTPGHTEACKRKAVSVLIAAFFVFSLFVIAFHHHDDECDHDDCSLCIAAHLVPAADIDGNVTLEVHQTVTCLRAVQGLPLFISLFLNPRNSRAPPSQLLFPS